MKIYNDEALDLAAAIVKLAVEDYRELKNAHKEKAGNKDVGYYSIKEIENFVKSPFCENILMSGLKIDMTGMELLRATT